MRFRWWAVPRLAWRRCKAGGAAALLMAGTPGCAKEEPPSVPQAPTPTAVTYVDASGYRVLVREFGPADGPPVVLIHGFKRNGWSFMPLLPALAARYHLVVPDLPGHGETYPPTPPPAGREEPSPPFPAMAQVVLAVADGLGLERFAIVGHSLGGVVGAQIALAHPERVTGLALLESTPTYQWPKAEWCGSDCADQLAFEEHAKEVNYAVHGEALYDALWDQYVRVDATAVFGRSDPPILWLMNTDGERDRDYFLEKAAGVDPQAPDRLRLVTVKDRGHFVQWTATRQVLDALTPFLAEVSGTGAPAVPPD